ncbi:hypothetical protein KDH_61530 [Dictyobacter sp. S3.2.2.5]|uniref:HTH cro/C1-type domain-containing protein n=1 Tax=Dictyobacter halimunensis TaxID=3026934 RepID=A0ABQ6FYG8_9CHLR|nr:hypothetical protein KDH_61530 [Dictyobacter sp. S3.2.2.5]
MEHRQQDMSPGLSFGAWLKEQRKKKHWTQAELAQRIHCASITIRKIEAGERHPSRQLTGLLAEQFRIAARDRDAFDEFAMSGSSSSLPDSIGATAAKSSPVVPMQDFSRGPERKRITFVQRPHGVHARTIYLLEASSDQLLLAERAQQRLKIASTTKIMTALLAIEQGNLNQKVIVRQEILDLLNRYQGHLSHLQAGDTFLLKDLLYALMLPSGDDAAFVIAEAMCGSVKEFVKLMHVYARRLRLTDTCYVNPSGTTHLNMLDNYEASNYSTATDLIRLTQYATTNSLFAQIVQLQRYELPESDDHHAYRWETINSLLYSYAGATGVKTGRDSEKDCSMVFSATSGRQRLIGVVLQEQSIQQRLHDAQRLLDWGFSQSY